ncbi:peptide-N-glycosidase F-related protein [Enhygromyxa salina]|uniref:Peptide-N-glycosidase F N-terminal domain-containing protein n=1 Tax=Enhygromyxa salina TaxID=215803 RepID=A0A2S9Y0I1_9BACT|nr:peptide-N-glycosidase F-related protein [Enhygromyxa salina]PRP98599.1 hypothetical protein ENSA7_65420 [Enhygromyxa salina]
MRSTLLRSIPCVCLLAAPLACGGPQADDIGEGETTGTEGSTDTDGGDGDGDGDGDPVPDPDPEIIWVMEDVVFYDGYAATVDEPVPEGVLRHSNSLHAIKFTDEQVAKIQNTLKIGVIVGALCDNYDRIGAVHLALVPKGAQTYVPADVQRVELARFITPFMNMNKNPKEVPYEFEVDSVAPILKNEALLAEYDLWFELSIFGVPYAANTEVPGCEGRIDTQLGSLLLYTDSMQAPEDFNVLLPLAIGEAFNNYAEGASDAIGTTRKTVEFELDADTDNAQLVLITSNHGANAGGEEYIRREHYAYVDGELALQYKPGRDTCEPFRIYNTQGNGIYGQFPKSDEEWQSFSNWCPGDVIDIRIIPWGPASAGTHEFVLDVPDATFVGGQGNFPFSLYVQAQ